MYTYLSGHDDLGRGMHDLGHRPTIPSTQFLQDNQIFTPKIQTEFQTNLQSICPTAFGIAHSAGNLSIAVGGVGGGFGGRIQGETFDILAFERPGFVEWIGHGVVQATEGETVATRRVGDIGVEKWWW